MFQKSNDEVYKQIWKGIQSDDNNIVQTADEGFEKVCAVSLITTMFIFKCLDF